MAMKQVAIPAVLLLALATNAMADLANPSTLIVKETTPSRFTVELTLPVINGKVVKARPILPNACQPDGRPEVSGDALRAVRTWTMTCDLREMVGAPVGIQGLLGTALDVQLTIETLDGRQHVEQLRPTRAYFVIPPPPTFAELALDAGGRGAARLLGRPEIALVVVLVPMVGSPVVVGSTPVLPPGPCMPPSSPQATRAITTPNTPLFARPVVTSEVSMTSNMRLK